MRRFLQWIVLGTSWTENVTTVNQNLLAIQHELNSLKSILHEKAEDTCLVDLQKHVARLQTRLKKAASSLQSAGDL